MQVISRMISGMPRRFVASAVLITSDSAACAVIAARLEFGEVLGDAMHVRASILDLVRLARTVSGLIVISFDGSKFCSRNLLACMHNR